MVDSHAYPGPFQVWAMPPSLSEPSQVVLRDFVAAGLVAELQPRQYQITMLGMQHLRRSRVCRSHRHVFHRRQVPVLQWTQWECIDWLLRHEWVMKPFMPRKSPPPLMLSASEATKGDLRFDNKLELSHDYLLCLIQTVDLAKKGLKSMEHKQPVSYYSGLLAMLDGSKPLPAIDNLIDDTLLVDLVVPRRSPSPMEARANQTASQRILTSTVWTRIRPLPDHLTGGAHSRSAISRREGVARSGNSS